MASVKKFSEGEIKRIQSDARRYIWHPFTQMAEWEKSEPVVIERGKGAYLYDIQGNKYLDATSSIWVNLHGHQKPELNRALKSQLGRISHSTLLGLSNLPAIELAKELVRITPKNLVRVFYSDNGSTAVEIALKIAFQYWRHRGRPGKSSFFTLKNAYHGDTIGSVSLGGIPLFHETFSSLLFPVHRAEAPYCYRCHLGLEFPACRLACSEEMERMIRVHRDELAAVVIEPLVQGAAGMLIWPKGYLKRVETACRENNVLLILDEVFTGFGRTGKMFACQYEGVNPDLLALSKGLTGGYLPLAATLATREIYEAFLGDYEEFKTFFHGHSFTGNQLGCAAALANLKIIERESSVKKVREKGRVLSKALGALRSHPNIGDIRQIGLIGAVEVVRDRITREPFSLKERIGHRIAAEALKRGMVIRPLGNILPLIPPLSTSRAQLARMGKILVESVKTVLPEDRM